MKKDDLVIGKTYVVTGGTGTYHSFSVGDKVKYIFDDGSSSPRFKRKSDAHEQYVTVCDIAKKPKMSPKVTHDLSKTYEVKVDNFKLTLRGDGTNMPELRIEAGLFEGRETHGYVRPSDLLAMAKQLKKWAKGLEANGS